MLATLMGWLCGSRGGCGALSDQLADAHSRIDERDELRSSSAADYADLCAHRARMADDRARAARDRRDAGLELEKCHMESIRYMREIAGLFQERNEVDQILGKALGFPKYFPDVSPEDDGAVCTGPHTIATLAEEAAKRIADLVNGPTRVPDGFVVVPVQPTRDMLDAAWADVLAEDAAGAWKSMIGAARSLDDAASGDPAAETGGPP